MKEVVATDKKEIDLQNLNQRNSLGNKLETKIKSDNDLLRGGTDEARYGALGRKHRQENFVKGTSHVTGGTARAKKEGLSCEENPPKVKLTGAGIFVEEPKNKGRANSPKADCQVAEGLSRRLSPRRVGC